MDVRRDVLAENLRSAKALALVLEGGAPSESDSMTPAGELGLARPSLPRPPSEPEAPGPEMVCGPALHVAASVVLPWAAWVYHDRDSERNLPSRHTLLAFMIFKKGRHSA